MNELNEVSANELNQIEGGLSWGEALGWLADKAKTIFGGDGGGTSTVNQTNNVNGNGNTTSNTNGK